MGLQRKVAAIELADGTVHTGIRIINPDLLRYGETAQKHRWPSMTVKNEVGTVPHLDYEDTFLAWAALRRLELYSDTWEAFKDQDCVAVSIEIEDVDPTRPATDAGSSSSSPTTPDSGSSG